MRLTFAVLILVFTVTLLSPYRADARPVQGSRTINLGMTGFSYNSSTLESCDSDGDDCSDLGKTTSWDLGVGLEGGYLLTDLLELGLRAGMVRSSSDWDPRGSSYGEKESSWMLTGHGYGKLHLGDDPKTVPFLAGGLGLDLSWDKIEYDAPGYEDDKTAWAKFTMFVEGGVDYYLADKYGISGSVIISRSGEAMDYDTDDDDNNIIGAGTWSIRVGLGVAAYY
jgi:hypothetical protein